MARPRSGWRYGSQPVSAEGLCPSNPWGRSPADRAAPFYFTPLGSGRFSWVLIDIERRRARERQRIVQRGLRAPLATWPTKAE
jgi:hypothetical protein